MNLEELHERISESERNADGANEREWAPPRGVLLSRKEASALYDRIVTAERAAAHWRALAQAKP